MSPLPSSGVKQRVTHMIRHILRMAAIIILGVACMFYAFLPGTHDRLAVSLSFMARSLGWAGLLLVPIGAVWLIYELVKRTQSRGRSRARRKGITSRLPRWLHRLLLLRSSLWVH